jgi:hypothetical protein
VSPTLIRALDAANFQEPALLITIRNVTSTNVGDLATSTHDETKHYVVKLAREMQYISFSRPGDNEVLATVIDLSRESVRRTVYNWCRGKVARDGNLYTESGVPSDYYFGDYADVSFISGSTATTEVKVDREMFAKEPAGWKKWLVGQFFESKPFDECHFRRRLLLCGLVFAPLLLTLGMVVRVIALAYCLFVGMRDIDWRGMLPFEDTLPIPHHRKSFWLHDKHGRSRWWGFFLVNPMTLILTPLVGWIFVRYILSEHHGHSAERYRFIHWGFWQTVLYVDGAIVGLALAICLIVFAVISVAFVADFLSSKLGGSSERGRKRAKRRQKQQETERGRMFKELEAMTCTTGATKATLDALPSEKRTLVLRFNALKGAVCKPFAR